MKQTILVLQEQIPAYRVPFFRSLSAKLRMHDLDLRVMSYLQPFRPDALGFGYRQVPKSAGGAAALGAILSERPAALVLSHSARFAPIASVTRLLQHGERRQLLWGMGLAGAMDQCLNRPAGARAA